MGILSKQCSRYYKYIFTNMQEPSVPKKYDEPEIVPLKEIFTVAYCNMDPISHSMGVSIIPLSQSNKWLVSARILDMVRLTTTDTGLAFLKFRKRAISYEEYQIYLKDIATSYNLDFQDMKHRMQKSGKPLSVPDVKIT